MSSIVPSPPDQTQADPDEFRVLVQCAITDRREKPALSGLMHVEVYADMLKLRRIKTPTTQPDVRQTRPRGRITGFSRRSRKRMIEKLAKLRSVDDAYFLHVTLPDDVPHDAEQFKLWLAALRKRILRRFPQAGGITRIEWMPRKSGEFVGELAPHAHIIVRGVTAREALFQRWLHLAWADIVYDHQPAGRQIRTRADKVLSRAHAMRYVSKYAAKTSTILNETLMVGRHWLAWGLLDIAVSVTLTITEREAVKLRRLARGLLKSRGRDYAKRLCRGSPHNGWSVFGLGDLSSSADFFASTVLRMLLDSAA